MLARFHSEIWENLLTSFCRLQIGSKIVPPPYVRELATLRWPYPSVAIFAAIPCQLTIWHCASVDDVKRNSIRRHEWYCLMVSTSVTRIRLVI